MLLGLDLALGIRSERRLCEDWCTSTLAYRWFCRLGIDGDAGTPFS